MTCTSGAPTSHRPAPGDHPALRGGIEADYRASSADCQKSGRPFRTARGRKRPRYRLSQRPVQFPCSRSPCWKTALTSPSPPRRAPIPSSRGSPSSAGLAPHNMNQSVSVEQLMEWGSRHGDSPLYCGKSPSASAGALSVSLRRKTLIDYSYWDQSGSPRSRIQVS